MIPFAQKWANLRETELFILVEPGYDGLSHHGKSGNDLGASVIHKRVTSRSWEKYIYLCVVILNEY